MPSQTSSEAPRRSEIAWIAAVFVASLALYAATLCPAIYTQDSPELVTAAATWGVPHSPGYPLFTMLYGAFVAVLPWGEVAWRCNLLTALLAAATIAALFRAARMLGCSRVASAAGALSIAVARDWWLQAISTEVYALDGLLLALGLIAALRVVRDPALRGRWIALGLTFGLACGHRPVNAVFLLPLLVVVEAARRRAAAPFHRHAFFFVAGAATTAVWAYSWIAAQADPAMNALAPTTATRLLELASGTAYARHWTSGDGGLAMLRAADLVAALIPQLGVSLAAAAVGCIASVRQDGRRVLACSLLGCMLLNVVFVALYNVPDGRAFLQPTWVAIAMLAAVGYQAVGERLPALRSFVVIGIALAPGALHYTSIDLSGVRTVDEYGQELIASTEPGALVLTYDDTARNAMLYHQVVGGVADDVAIVNAATPFAWHLRETTVRAPGFDTRGAEGDGWIALIARSLLQRERAVFTTDVLSSAQLNELLGPDLAARSVTIPTGLLYRILLPPDAASARDVTDTRMRAADRAFWPRRSLASTPRARHDAQLALITLRRAQARFLLATTYLRHGDVAAAEPHLDSVANSDVDVLEDVVIDEFRRAGAAPRRQDRARRCAQALVALRGGAPIDTVLAMLATR